MCMHKCLLACLCQGTFVTVFRSKAELDSPGLRVPNACNNPKRPPSPAQSSAQCKHCIALRMRDILDRTSFHTAQSHMLCCSAACYTSGTGSHRRCSLQTQQPCACVRSCVLFLSLHVLVQPARKNPCVCTVYVNAACRLNNHVHAFVRVYCFCQCMC